MTPAFVSATRRKTSRRITNNKNDRERKTHWNGEKEHQIKKCIEEGNEISNIRSRCACMRELQLSRAPTFRAMKTTVTTRTIANLIPVETIVM